MQVLIFLLLSLMPILTGCQSDSATVSKAYTGAPDLNFDSPPVSYTIYPANVLEDGESGWIFLSYTDRDNDIATDCEVSNRSYVNVSSPCTCNYGICYVKVAPFANYSGPVSFTYSVTANNNTSNLSSASFLVVATQDAPLASLMSFSMTKNTTYSSDGTISKPHLEGSDPDDDLISCAKASDPTSGSVTVNADCSFTYMPSIGFEGEDSFTFVVNDGTIDSEPATVYITVLP